MTIRLSFVVHSVEEEERMVSLLSYVGVRVISSVVVNYDDGAGTNGDPRAPR